MKPTHNFSFLLLLLLLPYEVNNPQLNYGVSSNSSTVLGYTCNSLPSCSSFLSFRSQPPFQSPSTCQALIAQNPYDPRKLTAGDEVWVLLTSTWENYVPIVFKRFVAYSRSVLHADDTYKADKSRRYGGRQRLEFMSGKIDEGGSGQKWVFFGIGIGIGAGFVLLCGALGWYYFCCFRVRPRQTLRPTSGPTSNDHGALSHRASTDPFMSSE